MFRTGALIVVLGMVTYATASVVVGVTCRLAYRRGVNRSAGATPSAQPH